MSNQLDLIKPPRGHANAGLGAVGFQKSNILNPSVEMMNARGGLSSLPMLPVLHECLAARG